MKNLLLAIPLSLGLGFGGCALFGSDPKAPSKIEQTLFDTVTNYVTKVVPVTNVHEVVLEIPIYKTNEQNQVVWSTNTVVQSITNITSATVTNEAYTLTPKQVTQDTVNAAGGVLNGFFPGLGGMVSTGAIALLGIWGHLRSYKRGSALAATTQEVETVREFIKALPNGEHYDQSIVDWIEQHQTELGVVNVVAPLVDKVSNPEAKVAAQGLIDTINALIAQKTQPVPATPAPAAPIGTVKLSA